MLTDISRHVLSENLFVLQNWQVGIKFKLVSCKFYDILQSESIGIRNIWIELNLLLRTYYSNCSNSFPIFLLPIKKSEMQSYTSFWIKLQLGKEKLKMNKCYLIVLFLFLWRDTISIDLIMFLWDLPNKFFIVWDLILENEFLILTTLSLWNKSTDLFSNILLIFLFNKLKLISIGANSGLGAGK